VEAWWSDHEITLTDGSRITVTHPNATHQARGMAAHSGVIGTVTMDAVGLVIAWIEGADTGMTFVPWVGVRRWDRRAHGPRTPQPA